MIRSVAETAMSVYGFETIGFLDGFEGLYTGKHDVLCSDEVTDILSQGGTILGSPSLTVLPRPHPFMND